MPKFITIGYGDQAGYDHTEPAVRDKAHAHDKEFQDSGVLMGIAGAPVQVRNHDGAQLETIQGPFLQSPLPLAGFAVIEADSLQDAIDIVSKTPCAVARGVVEVWSLQQPN